MIAEVDADASGGFELQLTADDLDDCHPGWVFVFAAGPAGTEPQTTALWPRAVYEVELPGDFVLTPASFECGEMQVTARLTGNNFPASAEVRVHLGGAEPFADNFVELGTFPADADGNLDAEVTLYGSACDTGELPQKMAVFGFVEGLAARWKAVYDIVP